MVRNVFNDDWNLPVYRDSIWNPAVDVKENEESFVLTADIPGLTKKDVKISINNRVLNLHGERKEEKENEDGKFYYRERHIGSFSRSFQLPETVNEDGIQASFRNGVLSIELPKLEESLPKDLEIKIN
jgi:HSP20 family protein